MSDATVIDALVVTLGLDPTSFTEGQKKALDAFKKTKDESVGAAKEMEARGKQASEFFSSIKKEALSLFAVIVGAGGLEQFTAKTVGGMAALGRQAQLMGVAAADLQAFKMMIDRTGASGDVAAASLTNLAQAMEVWRTRGTISKELLTGLNTIGADATDNPFQVYEKFAAWAKGKDAKYVNQEGQLLGLDPGSIANATKGADNYRNEMAESRRLGVPTDGDIKKVTELLGAFQKLRQAITGDANALLYDLAPALTQALDKTDSLVGAHKNLTKAILGVVTALSGWFALKPAAWVLKLLGIKAPAAAMDAVEHGAAKAAGGAVRAAARVAGPVGLAYDLLAPSQLGDGSMAGTPTAGMTPLEKAKKLLADKGGHDPTIEAMIAKMEAAGASGTGTNNLLDAVEGQESNGGRNAGYSRAGALGPFQFMPATAAQYGVTDRTDPAQSRAAATKMLTDLMRHYGNDLTKTLAAYNWGSGNVDKDIARNGAGWRDHLPAETRNYIKGIMGRLGGGGTTVNIGTITVATRATDAKGVAQGLGPAVRSAMAWQANTGLSG